MRLDNNLLVLLKRATAVAKQMGISELSMEDNNIGTMFRGMSDLGGTPVILHHMLDEDLPFGGLAIKDTGSFIAKLNLATDKDENFKIFLNVDERKNHVKSIELKGTKFKMSFITGSADAVKAPKRLKDPSKYSFQMEPDDVKTLDKAIKAMAGTFVTFVSDGNEVSFEIRVGKSDVFSYKFCDEVLSMDGDDASFAFSYPVKTITTLIKNSESGIFQVSKKGIFNGIMQDTNVFIFPRV